MIARLAFEILLSIFVSSPSAAIDHCERSVLWTDRSQTAAEVSRRATEFKSVTPAENSFGFSPEVIWYRLKCPSLNAKTDFLVEIGYSHLDRIEVYGGDSQLPLYVMGDTLPFRERPIEHRNFITPLTGQDLNQGVLFRVQSSSALQIPIHLYSPSEFSRFTQKEHLALGLYFGIILALIVYNLCLVIFVRELAFTFYVGYLIGFGLFQSSLNGLSFEYFWPNHPEFANLILPTLIWLTFGFIYFFTRSYLQTYRHFQRLDQSLMWIGSACFAMSVLTALLPYAVSIRLAAGFCLFTVPLIITAGALVYKARFAPAGFFLVAWLSFLIGIAVLNLKNFGWLPSNFITDYAMQIGSAIEVILLSLGLGHRVRSLEVAKRKREMEKLKLQSELDLERYARERDAILVNLSQQVAHDIRSPLSALRIATSKVSHSSEDQRNLINAAIDRIVEISNDLLDKNRALKRSRSIETIDLPKVILEIVGEMRIASLSTGVSIDVFIEPGMTQAQTLGSSSDLKRTLSNLLVNSIDAMPTKSGRVCVSLRKHMQGQVIEIEDNGCGIPNEILSSVGELGVTFGKSNGSGLGIAYAKKVIEYMGGAIEFISSPGKGTLVKVVLP